MQQPPHGYPPPAYGPPPGYHAIPPGYAPPGHGPPKKSKTGVVIGCVFAAILVVLVAIGARRSKPNSRPSAAADTTSQVANTPAVEVSAMQLHDAYHANEVAADAAYKGKKLRVTGTVAEIRKDAFDNVIVDLKTANRFTDVHAELADGQAQVAASLAKGDEVVFTCTGAGMVIGMVQLDDCRP